MHKEGTELVKLGKCLSVRQVKEKVYKTFEGLDPAWIDVIGEPEKCFKIFVWGKSGSGKSTFVLTMLKELAKFGKVYYNSYEEGDKKTFQNALNRADMPNYEGSQFSIVTDTFPQMMQRLKTNRAHFVVIDSANAMKMTEKQFEQLVRTYPKKAYLFIGWASESGHTKGAIGEAIRFWCDCKIFVKKGIANADSRYGKTKPYIIFKDETLTTKELAKIDFSDSRNNLPAEVKEGALMDN